MTRVAYIDCVGGAAGDMLLAAALDAGADREHVERGLASLPLDGLELRTGRAERHGLAAMTVAPQDPDKVHRGLAAVIEIIDGGALGARAAGTAREAFERLAAAEAAVHGTTPEDVHFHEVGARDAIADVCGVALAFESLDCDRVVCSPLPAGRGTVRSAHGVLPLPAPATLELLRHVPLYGVELDAELVTPTGAALVTTLADDFGSFPPMRPARVGMGAGARDLDELPNLVRLVIGEEAGSRSGVSVIEANIDDMPSELVPDAFSGLFAAGALDVWATQVLMKKGRPGLVLSALARPADEQAVADALLEGTTTLGVRIAPMSRIELDREIREVRVEGRGVRVKVGHRDGRVMAVAPEHDDCVAVAAATGRSVESVWRSALAAAQHEEDAGVGG